jgi:hypothetical protein
VSFPISNMKGNPPHLAPRLHGLSFLKGIASP